MREFMAVLLIPIFLVTAAFTAGHMIAVEGNRAEFIKDLARMEQIYGPNELFTQVREDFNILCNTASAEEGLHQIILYTITPGRASRPDIEKLDDNFRKSFYKLNWTLNFALDETEGDIKRFYYY